MDVVETIMDAGFDPSIRELMDDEAHEALVERALDGVKGAQSTYIEKFCNVVRGIDETMYKGLIRKIIKYGPDRGLEEFLEEAEDRVLLFENEVIDLLRDSPPMEEPVEVEIEDETPTDELVFRFWNPGDGATPVAEFTTQDPEARAGFVREGVHDVIAAAWIPEMRKVVEDTLHDLEAKDMR